MKIDLHVHSNVSDGQLSPAQLVEAAAAANLQVIALTDHDTSAGVPDAQRAARELGVRVIPGIEISTRVDDREYHILGYWIDPASAVMLEHQGEALERRVNRMHRMVEKLRGLGVDISYEDVLEAAGPEVHALGRPHLARALHAGGHTRYYSEAFSRYIADGGIAYVSEAFPTVAAAIELIHEVGGMAVWAHPDLDRFEADIRGFRDVGLDGVECFRPAMLPSDVSALFRRTQELGLIATGGSDWHGPGRAPLGEFYVRPHEVRPVLEWPDREAVRDAES